MSNEVKDHRDFVRAEMRTSAAVFIDDGHGCLKKIRAWTDDLSPSGAQVLTEHQLKDDRFLMRVAIPGIEERLFECERVRQGPILTKTLSSLDDLVRYTYGVRFVGVCDDAKLHELSRQCK